MKTVEVQLEAMRWWDVEELLPLEIELFVDTAWSAGQFWSELAHVPDTRAYVVARENGELVGYAGVYLNAPSADVQTIAVAPQAQGKGVGAALLRELMTMARDRGCTEMLLEVRAENAPAIALYSREGFTQIAQRRGYYGPGQDALIMRARPL